jgi:hypothetical protein
MFGGPFDSKPEKRLYHSLISTWRTQVNIYPQIPVRKVLGYKELKEELPLSWAQKNYLLKTEFDFVAYDKITDVLVVAVEFDGIGHGFSKDGHYITNVIPIKDPNRKWKLDAKLTACEWSLIPLVIVSFEETEPLMDAEDSLTILDGIIGHILSLRRRSEGVAQRKVELERASERDPTGNELGALLDEIELESDLETNPMMKAVLQHQRLIGYGKGTKPLRNRPGYVGQRHYLFRFSDSGTPEEVFGLNVYIREHFCGPVAHVLLQKIGEYRLYKTAWRLGYCHSTLAR